VIFFKILITSTEGGRTYPNFLAHPTVRTIDGLLQYGALKNSDKFAEISDTGQNIGHATKTKITENIFLKHLFNFI
jgi:hypothetical protein